MSSYREGLLTLSHGPAFSVSMALTQHGSHLLMYWFIKIAYFPPLECAP